MVGEEEGIGGVNGGGRERWVRGMREVNVGRECWRWKWLNSPRRTKILEGEKVRVRSGGGLCCCDSAR